MPPLPVFSHTEEWFETERVISSEKSPVVKTPLQVNAMLVTPAASTSFWTSRDDILQRWKAVNTHICIFHRHSNMTVYCSEIHTHTLHIVQLYNVLECFVVCVSILNFFQQTV